MHFFVIFIHLFIHPSIHPFFMHSFFTYSLFTHFLFIHFPIHSFILFIHQCIHSFIHSFSQFHLFFLFFYFFHQFIQSFSYCFIYFSRKNFSSLQCCIWDKPPWRKMWSATNSEISTFEDCLWCCKYLSIKMLHFYTNLVGGGVKRKWRGWEGDGQ